MTRWALSESDQNWSVRERSSSSISFRRLPE